MKEMSTPIAAPLVERRVGIPANLAACVPKNPSQVCAALCYQRALLNPRLVLPEFHSWAAAAITATMLAAVK